MTLNQKKVYFGTNIPIMSIFERNKEFYNYPIRLNEEQKKVPLQVITDFFIDFHLYESREHLATLLECALITSNGQFAEPAQRNAIFTFAEKLEELIEAVYILKLKKLS